MASENNYQGNHFKFSLYQEQDLIIERIFDADCYSAGVRNFVNIREFLPSIITKLQRLLSADEYETQFSISDKNEELDETIYDFKSYREYQVSLYPEKMQWHFDEPEHTLEHKIIDNMGNERIMRGTEFKMGLYINNKVIVERTLYVNNYNPDAKVSMDLYYVVSNICNMIINYLKKSDIKYQFDDEDIKTKFNLTQYQLNELTPEKRREYVYKLITDEDIMARFNLTQIQLNELSHEKRKEFMNNFVRFA